MTGNRPIKVAFIEGKMNSGGKKTLTMQYFLNFDPKKVDIHFICDSDSNAIPVQEIERHGGHVHVITPYQSIFKNMSDMETVLRNEDFDVLHAFNSTMNVFPLRVAKKCGIPVRISESLSMANELEPKTFLKLILRKFSKVYATHYMSCGEDCGRWMSCSRRAGSTSSRPQSTHERTPLIRPFAKRFGLSWASQRTSCLPVLLADLPRRRTLCS